MTVPSPSWLPCALLAVTLAVACAPAAPSTGTKPGGDEDAGAHVALAAFTATARDDGGVELAWTFVEREGAVTIVSRPDRVADTVTDGARVCLLATGGACADAAPAMSADGSVIYTAFPIDDDGASYAPLSATVTAVDAAPLSFAATFGSAGLDEIGSVTAADEAVTIAGRAGGLTGPTDFLAGAGAPPSAGVTDASGSVFVTRLDADGVAQWLRLSGDGPGPLTAGTPEVFDASTRADGSSVVVGAFGTDLSFDGGASTAVSTDGSRDLFLAGFDGAGAVTFVQRFGTSAGDGTGRGAALALEDGGALAAFNVDHSQIDGINVVPFTTLDVVRVDATGALVWSVAFDGGYTSVADLALLSDGTVILAFEFAERLILPDASGMIGDGFNQAVLARLTLDGAFLSARQLASSGEGTFLRTVLPLADGGFALAGSFYGSLTLDAATTLVVDTGGDGTGGGTGDGTGGGTGDGTGGGTGDGTGGGTGDGTGGGTGDGTGGGDGDGTGGGNGGGDGPGMDGFIALFDAEEHVTGLFVLGGRQDGQLHSAAPTADGGFVVVGSFVRKAHVSGARAAFDVLADAPEVDRQGRDGLAIRLGADLSVHWLRRIAGAGDASAEGVAVLASGRVIVAGSNIGSAVAAPGPAQVGLTETARRLFVAGFDELP